MAASNPLIVSMIIKADASGVSPAAKEAAGALDMVGAAANKNAQKLDDLREKYAPLYAAEKAHAKSLEQIASLTKAGMLSETERTAALGAANAALARQQALAGGAANATRLQSHEVANLTYQLNDIGTMLASGQSPFIMMMQQGPQVSQILGKRGLGQILPAIGQGLSSLITPTNLVLAGMLAVGYAGSAAWKMLTPAIEPINDVLDRQKKQLDGLKISWGAASEEAAKYGRQTTVALSYGLERSEAALSKRLRDETKDGMFSKNNIQSVAKEAWDNNKSKITGDANFPVGSTFLKGFREELDATIKATAEGKPAIIGFIHSLQLMGERTQNSGIKSMVDDIVAGLEPLAEMSRMLIEVRRRREELAASIDPNGRVKSFGKMAGDDMGNLALFESQQEQQRKRMLAARDISLSEITARSPAERAAAARAAAANDVVDGESAQTRALRIETAGTLALAKANHDLSEAQRTRALALKDTMAQAELDLLLVGKSASEVAQLRMEYQLTAAVRADAAARGVEASAAELQAIKKQAAEYAQLKTLTDARSFITSKNEEIAKLRLEQQLLGTSVSIHSQALAQYEAELEIRHRGLDAYGAEANAIRQKSAELARVTDELHRQQDAWSKVQSTGEGAIDSLFNGDWKGALADIEKSLLELSVKNPLKNALFGTDKGTLDDLGGLKGLVARLFGGANDNAASAVSSALGSSVSSMMVTAGTVMINGGVAGGIAGSTLGNNQFTPNTTLGELISGGGNPSQNLNGNPLRTVGNFKAGVDPKLMDILSEAAQKFGGYQVDAISGYRAGDPRFHGKGLATDIQLTDLISGRKLGNYQDASSFGQYEKFAQTARQVQMQKYPELADKFRWGGYFAGGKGKYGAMDTMHFDLGGDKVGMGGGSWDKGLSSGQMSLWKIQASNMNGAAKAVEALGTRASTATNSLGTMSSGLQTMGNGLGKFGSMLSQTGSNSGGGGIFGFLGKMFGGLFGGNANAFPAAPPAPVEIGGLFAGGGDIWGKGTGTSDSIPILASTGEHMTNAKSAAKYRPLLHAINNDTLGKFATGGDIGSNYGAGITAANFNRASAPQITFINNGTPQRVVEQRHEEDGQGGRRTTYILDDAAAANIGRAGSASGRAVAAFGGKRQTVMR